MKYIYSALLTVLISIAGCSTPQEEVVNVYSTRHYTIDEELNKEFTKRTGIKVNFIQSDPDALLSRMEQEKDNPQADVFFTAEYIRLYRAKQLGLLESVSNDTLLAQTTPKYRDKDLFWYGMSSRLRIIAIDKASTLPRPKTYADLTNEVYRGKILVRTGNNAYNISLVAALISKYGEEGTRNILQGLVANFARTPEGNDRKQVADVYAKKGEIAILNSYYMGHMYNSVDPEVQKAARSVDLIYPESTHFNISGLSIVKNAKNKTNAIKYLEFLTGAYAQQRITDENYEHPVNPAVKPTDLFVLWEDTPKVDDVELDSWGGNYDQAVRLIGEAGWQ